jgi:hypothetical protein
MTFKEFKERAVAAGAEFRETKAVNTNNDWGFGGRIGKDHIFAVPGDGLFVAVEGTLYFRHLKSQKHELLVDVSGVYRRFKPELFLRLLAEGGLPACREFAAKH